MLYSIVGCLSLGLVLNTPAPMVQVRPAGGASQLELLSRCFVWQDIIAPKQVVPISPLTMCLISF